MSRSPKAEEQKETIVSLLQANHIDTLRQRLDAGDFDPAIVPEVIWHLAAHPAVDLLDRWLDAGVDPNWSSRPRPLVLAASCGELANVESLLAAGADPNIQAGLPAGPLHKAVNGGHDAVAFQLLAAGADPTEPPGIEELALVAAGLGMVKTLGVLLDYGVHVETRGSLRPTQYGNLAETRRRSQLMMRAIQTELNPEERAELEELKARNQERRQALGAPPPYRDATLLAIAHGEGHDAVVELLLKRGADPATREERVGPDALDEDETSPMDDLAELANSESEPWNDEAVGDEGEWNEPDLPDLPKLTEEELKRYDRETVLARLSQWTQRQNFRAAVKRLEDLAGNEARPWGDGSGVAVHVDSRSRGGKMLRDQGFEALRNALGASQLSLVMSRERAVLLPTTDPLDVLTAFAVSAPNVSIRPEDILATFRDFPISLHHVRYDMVVGYVQPVPKDQDTAQDLALRYLALHPEVLFEDDPVKIVTHRLLKDGRVYLWWD